MFSFTAHSASTRSEETPAALATSKREPATVAWFKAAANRITFGRAFASTEVKDVEAAVSVRLGSLAVQPVDDVLVTLGSSTAGLDPAQVAAQLHEFGPNKVQFDNQSTVWSLLLDAFVNPFAIVLVGLAIIAIATDDKDTFTIIMIMVLLSAGLRFWQDLKSTVKASKLASGVKTQVHVRRRLGNGVDSTDVAIDSADLVPGDIIDLRNGDVVPADCILISGSSLSVSQSMLTGEAVPVDKMPFDPEDIVKQAAQAASLWSNNVLLSGTSVAFGQGLAVVATTGSNTYLASMGGALVRRRKSNAFEKTVRNVSYLLLAVTLILSPIVFVIQGLVDKKEGWKNALLFALSVAVGLTPEMLPVVVNANLARGAIALGKKNVLVKRLDGVQNLGGITTFCTDKTGTLTVDEVTVSRSVDIDNQTWTRPMGLAVINASLQTGARSLIDQAIVGANGTLCNEIVTTKYAKLFEVPFDSSRRMLSVIASDLKTTMVVTKGAVEEVLSRCAYYLDSSAGNDLFDTSCAQRLTSLMRELAQQTARDLNSEGLRLVAVAIRPMSSAAWTDDGIDPRYLERDLVFVGFVAFLDPPKEDARPSIAQLRKLGVEVKILTGDAPEIARKVACHVGLLTVREAANPECMLTGEALTVLSGELASSDLLKVVQRATVLAKLSPFQKKQVIELLQSTGRGVGMMGDGVNDALALQAADVGISVDTGTEVAKAASDIILLEKDLAAVYQGVLLGRRSMVNTIKYFKMTLSSNFGNVFSILVASAWLPYQPMQALQILVQNILYDISQSSIPFDNVDDDMIAAPVHWSLMSIVRFMLVFGPTSSVFDITTFTINWLFFNFRGQTDLGTRTAQTHWFMEGSISQTIVVYVLRTDKLPFIESRPSKIFGLVVLTMLLVAQVLPWIPGLNSAFGFVNPKPLFYPFLLAILVAYCALVQLLKGVYCRVFNEWF